MSAEDAMKVDYAAVEVLRATVSEASLDCHGSADRVLDVARNLGHAVPEYGDMVQAAADFAQSWQAALTVLGTSLGVVAGNAGKLVIDVGRIDDGIDPRFRI